MLNPEMEGSAMQSESMMTMKTCCGDQCDCVPDEVSDAVSDSLKRIPEGNGPSRRREARAVIIASRMAAEGWQFCSCFPMLRTPQHELIFSLVHINLANRLAHEAAMAKAA
jgi:hypothetical protein